MELISKLKAESRRLKAFGRICLGSWLLLLGSAGFAGAQSFSFSDLFGQGNKELKNMLTQIEAMNAFIQSTEQGYKMLHSEWSMIGNWKNAEFGLHQAYYTSLSNVNPAVKSDPDIATIQGEQQTILNLLSALGGLQGLQLYEQSYVQSVSSNLLKGCDADLQQLQKVLQNGTLTMGDDERLEAIAKLQADMLAQYRFAQSFCNSVRLLVVQRNGENNEMLNLNGLYETH